MRCTGTYLKKSSIKRNTNFSIWWTSWKKKTKETYSEEMSLLYFFKLSFSKRFPVKGGLVHCLTWFLGYFPRGLDSRFVCEVVVIADLSSNSALRLRQDNFCCIAPLNSNFWQIKTIMTLISHIYLFYHLFFFYHKYPNLVRTKK